MPTVTRTVTVPAYLCFSVLHFAQGGLVNRRELSFSSFSTASRMGDWQSLEREQHPAHLWC